jgi:hypothetical protein
LKVENNAGGSESFRPHFFGGKPSRLLVVLRKLKPVSEPLETKILTIVAGAALGALMGGLVSFWNTRLQDFLKRKALHRKLRLIPIEAFQNKVAVRVFNGHVLPLTDCWAYITLHFEKSDIVDPPDGRPTVISPQHPAHLTEDRLCWSTHYPSQNPAIVDIYSGEYQSLEVFVFEPTGKWLGILSEKHSNPYRVFLRGDKVYLGTLRFITRETEAKMFRIEIDLRNKNFPLKVLGST